MTDRSTNRSLFSLQNPNFDNPNPKIDRKHYLLTFYNLDITFLHQFMELPTLSTNFIEFKRNFYNLKTQQQPYD